MDTYDNVMVYSEAEYRHDSMDWFERQVYYAYHAVKRGRYTLTDLAWMIHDNHNYNLLRRVRA